MEDPKRMKTSAIVVEMVGLLPKGGALDLGKVDPTGGGHPAGDRFKDLAAELDERVPPRD